MHLLLIKTLLLSFYIAEIFCGYISIIPNKKLKTRFLLNAISTGSLNGCANRCVYQTNCVSAMFDRKTRICELYNISPKNTTADDTSPKDNVVLFEIEEWPMSRTRSCWNKPCEENKTCVPTGVTYRCDKDEKIGCQPFKLPEHGVLRDGYGNAVYDHEDIYPIGTTILLNCEHPYLTTNVYWLTSFAPKCRVSQGSLGWNFGGYTCYSIDELCTKQIVDRFYPTRANITVSSSVDGWEESQALFSSAEGWVTNQTNEYIQITLDDKYWIGGVETKGGSNGNYVRTYYVKYSRDCNLSYLNVQVFNGSGETLFTGNEDANSSVVNHFQAPIEAKCFRIEPYDYSSPLAMRLEILACKNY